MANNGLIDSSGSTPSVKIGAVVTTFLSTIIYGWYVGFINVLDAVGGGVTSTLDDVTAWLAGGQEWMPELGYSVRRGGVLDLLFGGAETFLDAATQSHVEWLSNFGLWGQLFAFAEGIAVFVFTLWALSKGVQALVGAI